jgi:hypothetical protein
VSCLLRDGNVRKRTQAAAAIDPPAICESRRRLAVLCFFSATGRTSRSAIRELLNDAFQQPAVDLFEWLHRREVQRGHAGGIWLPNDVPPRPRLFRPRFSTPGLSGLLKRTKTWPRCESPTAATAGGCPGVLRSRGHRSTVDVQRPHVRRWPTALTMRAPPRTTSTQRHQIQLVPLHGGHRQQMAPCVDRDPGGRR